MNINTDFKLELQEKGKQRRKEQQLKKSEKKTPRESNNGRAELDRIIEKERRSKRIHKSTWRQLLACQGARPK